MADVRSAWNEAGDKLQTLGASLKQHYAQQRGEEAGETKEQVSDAFKKVGDALQGAFDALGAAAKDPAVKDEVKQTGKSVADALTVTFAEISDDVRKAFDRRKGDPAASGESSGEASGEGTPAYGTPPPSAQWTAPATSESTASPAGPQEHGVDGGTAPQTPSEQPSEGTTGQATGPLSDPLGEQASGSPQDRQDPSSNI